ncbi:MAG: hypothetical protein ACTSQJ_00635 [Promethearchaeota archaeon]
MKKVITNALICILIINMMLTLNFLVVNGLADLKELDPKYGKAPEIDGNINRTANEWDNASKITLNLYSNLSIKEFGLPIKLWIMQNESNLFISIQFELESHSPDEFVGLLISKDDSYDDDDFIDAKIVQGYHVGQHKERFKLLDYYIENGNFIEDDEFNGKADAELEGNKIIYEIKIPVNNTNAENNDEDVFLDYGEYYAFKVIYGENPSYLDGIKMSNIVLVKINYPPQQKEKPIWDFVLFICSIVAFSVIGGLFGFYIYKMVNLKKKIERFRG